MSLSIITPYRNRPDHLKVFIPYMRAYLPDAEIIIVEQADDKPFNRGKLLNIGAIQSKLPVFDDCCYVFHDIDMLPIKVSYLERKGVTQIAFSDIQLINYLGGVTMFEWKSFWQAEGFHNDYFHRAEDNEMRFNLMNKKISVLNRFGIFKDLWHERTPIEFDPALWQKAQLPRTKNMLKTCDYKFISKEVKDGYTHLKVLL